ncbi:hypothetical protein [Pseudozobellia thermophila]|uniref:Uncharacterized protein n=1 Tax=Pseudozobellia thermophila TaxID=192903 RepID=A0A1M6HS15_9FLAO|nr:hypothetical protein [Pseudozobellia thermophila]SHJ25001.1 hypothetical protein SAMN04488513_103156 [Pseudozobellia thermophila]
MKQLPYIPIFLFCLGLFTSFRPDPSCEYANSNIGYVKTEIEKALSMTDLQLARFHTYKAINAIEKSKKELKNCGCEYAIENINEGTEHLKLATKTSNLASTAIFLKKALNEASETIGALKNHDKHVSPYGNDVLVLNTVNLKDKKAHQTYTPYREKALKQKVDSALVAYRKSLEHVISTVDCREAKAYADRIYEDCEQQLLKPHLSEGRKYYNLRTKEITAEALEMLGECGR